FTPARPYRSRRAGRRAGGRGSGADGADPEAAAGGACRARARRRAVLPRERAASLGPEPVAEPALDRADVLQRGPQRPVPGASPSALHAAREGARRGGARGGRALLRGLAGVSPAIGESSRAAQAHRLSSRAARRGKVLLRCTTSWVSTRSATQSTKTRTLLLRWRSGGYPTCSATLAADQSSSSGSSTPLPICSCTRNDGAWMIPRPAMPAATIAATSSSASRYRPSMLTDSSPRV